MSTQGEPSGTQDPQANQPSEQPTGTTMDMSDGEESYLTTDEAAKRFKIILAEIDKLKKGQNAKQTEQGSGKSVQIGQILKPTKPELFDGTSSKLPTFLTQCRAYFTYFPTSLAESSAQVHYAAGRLTGNAAIWFEPTLKEVLTTHRDGWSDNTKTIYNSFKSFEEALQKNFGVVDEKTKAEIQIKKLRQTKSASAYATSFLQYASKLSWGQEALMATFFDGLKQTVQAELFKEDRPAQVVDYIGMAVKIDDRQFAWRTRSQGSSNNQHFNKPRYDNKGQDKQVDTSHGTAPGPMNLGGINQQRHKRQIKCYNCGKMGHIARNCRSKKQQWTPVPEGAPNPNNNQHPLKMIRPGPTGIQEGMREAKKLAQRAARREKQAMTEATRVMEQLTITNTQEALWDWLQERLEYNTLAGKTNKQLARQRRKHSARILRQWLFSFMNLQDHDVLTSRPHHKEHAINCWKRPCYWHDEQLREIRARVRYMTTQRYDFEDIQGHSVDSRWYLELWRHGNPAHQTWPDGHHCPQHDPRCVFPLCNHQTDEELRQKTVIKNIGEAITDLQINRMFTDDTKTKIRLDRQIRDLQQDLKIYEHQASKDDRHMYRDRMLAKDEPSDDDLEW